MSDELSRELDRWRRRALIFGVGVLIAAVADGILHPEQFFRSYLLAYVFWVGLPLGCSAFLLVHYLTGGKWGVPVKRPLEAGVRTLPLMIALLVPLLFGLGKLFPWMNPAMVAAAPDLQLKRIYLNVPFFLAREIIYFGCWLWIAYRLSHFSAELDRTGDPSYHDRLESMAGWALVVYAMTITFFAVDWVMSLEAHWFSTIFGLIFIVIQVQAAIALGILVAWLLGNYEPTSATITPARFNDLGNLLLTFVMLWAYLAFSQFLVIWSGDLLADISWYLSRAARGWSVLAAGLIVFYFAVPFFLLLMRDVKRRARVLARLCVVLLLMNFVDVFWMVVPSFHKENPRFYLLDLLLPLGFGGIWAAYYIRNLSRHPLLPYRDSGFEGVLQHGD